MPTINNETVIGSGYLTYRNARPQLLSNGWIVVAVNSLGATRLQFRVKKSPTGAWEDLAFLTTSNVMSWSITAKGTRVFATFHTSSSNATSFLNFEATTVSSTVSLSAVSIDNTTNSGAFYGEDLAVSESGNELYHVFSGVIASYPNTGNIRFLKGTIATDGSVSWSSVVQLTKSNNTSEIARNPCVSSNNNQPFVFFEVKGNGSAFGSGYHILVMSPALSGTSAAFTSVSFKESAWGDKIVYSTPNTSYPQEYVNAIFIPQSINSLTSGRWWVGWDGKDATDSKNNIRTSFSDDNGATWATHTKQTSGNLYDQSNVSLSAEKAGKVFLYWDGDEDASGNTVTVTKEKVYNGATWGTTTSLTGDNHFNVAALYDRSFTFSMTRAPLVRRYASGVRFTGNYFAPASVSPASSALGDKTVSSVLSYTVTPESGSTITSIVEKVNGTTVNTYSNPASLSRTFTIPLANWDALKYYNTHTISVTVTDSNGMANTQTYTFNKTLANDASLLEGTKAAKDGKDRISTKRDVLAGQVGLAAGSTFDAISAQLASGNAFKKFASGTVTGTNYSAGNNQMEVTVSGLTFTPKSILIYNERDLGSWISGQTYENPIGDYRSFSNSLSGVLCITIGSSNSYYVNATGFFLPIRTNTSTRQLTWIALG